MTNNGWRKIEDENGFPFYFNENTKKQQWDHPKFSDLRHQLDDYNFIHYSSYRIAFKFRVLQQALFMDDIQLAIIKGVFERHRLGANESSLRLETCDLEAVLSDIYFAANKKNHLNIDIDFATEMMLTFLYNIYDIDRKGNIQVSSTKLILAILSCCTTDELYNFLFELCRDHNNCVTRLRLQTVLSRLVDVTNFLHEDVNFGLYHLDLSLETCFKGSPGLVGINESSFIAWLEKIPSIFAWLPIMYRIKMTESVVHNVKCVTCKTVPIVGFRYRCQKCLRYTQCQRCFLTGRLSRSHKNSHALREYTSQGHSKYEVIKSFMASFICYSNLEVNNNNYNMSVIETKPLRFENDIYKRSPTANVVYESNESVSSPQIQLQLIIRQLELQNRELQKVLHTENQHSDTIFRQYLEDHRINIASQIQKLKILKDSFKFSLTVPKAALIESTPMNANNNRNIQYSLDFLSPIMQKSQDYYTNPIITTEQSNSTEMYNIGDVSTWIGGKPTSTSSSSVKPNIDLIKDIGLKSLPRHSPVREFHNDLDDALAKLQQILDFSLDDSITHAVDNCSLKNAVYEVEGMLTNFIDNVESSRSSSSRGLQPPNFLDDN